MADDEPATLETLQTALEAETDRYRARRGALDGTVARLVTDPAELVDSLVSWAEEFGRDHAFDLFAETVHRMPVPPQSLEQDWPELAAMASRQIGELLDSQDRLDELTERREKLLARDAPRVSRVVNIHGQEFEIDAVARELRAVASADERYPLEQEPELSLTEQAAKELGSEKAQPQLQEKDRSRSR